MSSEQLIQGGLSALGGAVVTLIVGVLMYLAQNRSAIVAREDALLRASDDLIESLQREVSALRERVVEQDRQILELRRQLGIGTYT